MAINSTETMGRAIHKLACDVLTDEIARALAPNPITGTGPLAEHRERAAKIVQRIDADGKVYDILKATSS